MRDLSQKRQTLAELTDQTRGKCNYCLMIVKYDMIIRE